MYIVTSSGPLPVPIPVLFYNCPHRVWVSIGAVRRCRRREGKEAHEGVKVGGVWPNVPLGFPPVARIDACELFSSSLASQGPMEAAIVEPLVSVPLLVAQLGRLSHLCSSGRWLAQSPRNTPGRIRVSRVLDNTGDLSAAKSALGGAKSNVLKHLGGWAEDAGGWTLVFGLQDNLGKRQNAKHARVNPLLQDTVAFCDCYKTAMLVKVGEAFSDSWAGRSWGTDAIVRDRETTKRAVLGVATKALLSRAKAALITRTQASDGRVARETTEEHVVDGCVPRGEEFDLRVTKIG